MKSQEADNTDGNNTVALESLLFLLLEYMGTLVASLKTIFV